MRFRPPFIIWQAFSSRRASSREEVSVETVEHLLAALVSMRIDNVIVELNSRSSDYGWQRGPVHLLDSRSRREATHGSAKLT